MNRYFRGAGFRFWLAVIAIAAAYAAIRFHYLKVPLNRDEGIYAYGGRLILQGKLPCKDIPDYNPPFVFLVNALMMLIIKPGPLTIHLFFYAYNFLAMLVLGRFAFLYFRSRRAALWSALAFGLFTASPSMLGFAATAEHLTLLPTVAALLLAYMGIRKDKRWLLFLSGNLAASACWIKQQAGFTAIAILIFVLFEAQRRWKLENGSWKKAAGAAAVWIGGTFFITGLLAGYYYLHDGLADLLYWSFIQGFHYSEHAAGIELIVILFGGALEIVKTNWALCAAAVGGGIWGWAQKDRRGVTAFLFFALSAAGVYFGRAYPHYFLLVAPGFALSAGVFLDKLARKKILFTALALCGIAAGLAKDHWANLSLAPHQISNRYFPGNPFPLTNVLARQLGRKTRHDDKILVVGSEPQIFLLSNRHTATSFLTITPLTERFPRHREFQDRYWADVVKNRPAYIVFMNLAMSICWDGMADFYIFNQLLNLISTEYDLEQSFMVKNSLHFMEISPHMRHVYVFRRKDLPQKEPVISTKP